MLALSWGSQVSDDDSHNDELFAAFLALRAQELHSAPDCEYIHTTDDCDLSASPREAHESPGRRQTG